MLLSRIPPLPEGGHLLLMLFAMLLSPAISSGQPEGRIAPFDQGLYETGYSVFLANGNLRDALRLTEAALSSRPDDRVWRKRAAQCAEWEQKPQKALQHWLYLATVLNEAEAHGPAMRLARQTGDLRAEKRLLKLRLVIDSGLDTLKRLVRVCEILGEAEEAIAILEGHKNGEQRKFSLEQLPRLYEATGRPEKAIQTLMEYGGAYPWPAATLLELAKLRYSRGDVQGAYRTLIEAQDSQVAADPAYLAALSDVCWMMQDIDCAVRASKGLIAKGIGRQQDSSRLFFHYRESNPEQAFAAALGGWVRFRTMNFFTAAAQMGEFLGHWSKLEGLLSGMYPEERALLEPYSNYWLLRARTYHHLGNSEEALSGYRQAIQIEPMNEDLTADYIWILIDLDRHQDLKKLAGSWLERGVTSPRLFDALGSAFVSLGDYRNALWFFRKRSKAYRDDPVWLAAYADVLEQNGFAEAAFSERIAGLRIVCERMKNLALSPPELKGELITHARLSLQIRQGDALDGIMHKIMQGGQGDTSREMVTAWALATERHDFARFWHLNSGSSDSLQPEWAQLGFALVENDRTKISALLDRRLSQLPYRDAVEGARRVGALPLAEELAWQSSWQNPDDPLLFSQLREILDAHPSSVGYRLRLLDRADVGGIENRVHLQLPLTRRFTLFSEFILMLNDRLESGAIGDIPSRDLLARVGVSAVFEKAKTSLAGGWRSAVEEFPFFDASGLYRLSRGLSIEGELQYSAAANETVPLAIGGMKDQAALTLTLAPTARDSIQARVTQAYLRDQSRRRLGKGGTYALDLSHKLTFDYPDVAVRVFGGYHDYSSQQEPRGKTRELLPGGLPRDTSFFVPESFAQVGVGLSFGQGYRARYSKNWKPFGSAGLFWRKSTGTGFHYELGVHGPLLGNDSLVLQFIQNSGAFNTSDLSTAIQVGYARF